MQEQQTRIHDVDKQVLYRAIEHYEEQIKRLESVQRAKEERVKRERAFMVNVNGQQVNGMWEAILWLRANQDKLQDVVYEPVRLVANSKTPEAAKYLESLISWDRSKVGRGTIQSCLELNGSFADLSMSHQRRLRSPDE